MQSTTNYGLNIVEGTDIVNPLTQFNPNFTDIDSIMKANADASVDHATCIKTGTVHAVTRTNTGASVFRFTATGNWNTGDTMTVDGTLVSVFNPDGSSPLDGCFVINTEVLAAIQGTRVTLYVSSSSASNVAYDNTTSGLSATNVQGAIDEIDNTLDNIIESGSNADGLYIKFADGTMICSKIVNYSGAINTPNGALFESDNIALGAFAASFTSVPAVTLGCDIYGFLAGTRSVTASNAGTTNIDRVTSLNSANANISVIAVGKWQ